jgi:hypothetical protein
MTAVTVQIPHKPCDNRMTNCYSRHIRGFCQRRCSHMGGDKAPCTGIRKKPVEFTEEPQYEAVVFDFGTMMVPVKRGMVQI